MMNVQKQFLLGFLLVAAANAVSMAGALAPDDPRPVNVMSFNIRYGLAKDGDDSWENRKQLVMDVIRADDPDILGLQEALQFQLDAICDTFPEYGRVGIGRDPGGKGEYAAILYRRERFDVDQTGTFWLSETPEKPSTHWGNRHLRICTWARLLDRTRHQFLYVFNTHFDHQSQPAREQSSMLIAKRIAQRRQTDPVILMGDFNAGESNPAMVSLRQNASISLADSYRKVHPKAAEAGTFNGFKGKSSGEKIDHVFVDSGFEVIRAAINRYNVNGRYPSDHFPVTALLKPVSENSVRNSIGAGP